MPLFPLGFNEISEADLQRLIDNGVPEGRSIDYKRDRFGNADADKKEFLKDVSAFANAAGGHLLVGIDEDAGVPIALRGLPGIDVDSEIQRLESIIRDNLEPRLVGLSMKGVALSSGNSVIVIRIGKSWNPPHRVNFKGWNKFFTRNSNGSHEVSVEELRALFLQSSTLADRVRNFRVDRIARICADDTPILTKSSGRLVLHVVSLNTIGDMSALDLERIDNDPRPFLPLDHLGYSISYNFDGYLIYFQASSDDACTSYSQLFRDGSFESVLGEVIYPTPTQDRFICLPELEKKLFAAVERCISGLSNVEIQPPYVVMFSILDARKSAFFQQGWSRGPRPLDRDDILAPPVTVHVNSLEGQWHHLIRPAMDAVWNAYGYRTAIFFNDDGVWHPQ